MGGSVDGTSIVNVDSVSALPSDGQIAKLKKSRGPEVESVSAALENRRIVRVQSSDNDGLALFPLDGS